MPILSQSSAVIIKKTGLLGICLTRLDHACDVVNPQIERIAKEAGRPQLYDEIEAACDASRAFLFTSPKIDGFFVLRPRPNNVMQVWVAYCSEPNAVQKYQSVIKHLCRDVGVTEIEFETALPAMERFMPRFGWEKAYTVWRQKI